MNSITDEILTELVASLRSGSWIQETVSEGDVSLSPAELATLKSASEDLVSTVDALVSLLEGDDRSDLFDLVNSVLDGFGAISSNFPVSVLDELGLNAATDVLLRITAHVLDEKHPELSGFFRTIGLIEVKHLPAIGRSNPVLVRRANPSALVSLINDPLAYLIERFTDRASPFSGSGLLSSLAYFGNAPIVAGDSTWDWLGAIRHARSGLAEQDDVITQASLISANLGGGKFFGAGLYVIENGAVERIRFGITPVVGGLDRHTINLSDSWTIEVKGDLPAPGMVVEVEADSSEKTLIPYVSSQGPPSGDREILLRLQGYEVNPLVVPLEPLGSMTINGITTQVSMTWREDRTEEFKVEAEVESLDIDLTVVEEVSVLSGNDEQVSSLRIRLAGNFGWSSKSGVYGSLGAGLAFDSPLHISVGPFSISHGRFGLTAQSGMDVEAAIRASAGVDVRIAFGPIKATAEDFGFDIDLFPSRTHDSLVGSLRSPSGVGLVIDGGGIKGAGFLEFDKPNKRYAGILQLSFGEIGLTAIGLITTRMPDGSDGYSMLINISTEFNPPIQLSFGFTLKGVGGLIGINRSMVVDALRDGLRNHTLDSVLFPEDPILNAAKIISDLRSVMPPTEDRFVIGPMFKIGWGSPNIISADIAVLFELPDPVRIVVLGQLAAILPSEDKTIIELHIDVLGVIEPAKQSLAVDATLYDSRILSYALTGDAALRSTWSNNPQMILSLGGFHPRFSPPPAFPSLRRLTLNLSSSENLQLYCMVYQALTPNTLQFGASLDLFAKAGSASVEGHLSFDALIYFSPFAFEVDINGNVAARYRGHKLFGVRIALLLSGPTPWNARGKASFDILWWEISVGFNRTWGRSDRETLPAVDPWGPLKIALNRPESWGSTLPAGRTMVEALRSLEEEVTSDIVILHPLGALEIRENVLPLGIRLSKFGNAPVKGHHTFHIDTIDAAQGEERKTLAFDFVNEHFARAQFEELSKNERLTLPSFEKMRGGVAVSADALEFGDRVLSQPIQYESILIGEEDTAQNAGVNGTVLWEVAEFQLRGNAVSKGALDKTRPNRFEIVENKSKVKLVEERYAIVNNADISVVDLGTGLPQNNGNLARMEADQVIESYLKMHPEENENIQVVSSFEMAA